VFSHGFLSSEFTDFVRDFGEKRVKGGLFPMDLSSEFTDFVRDFGEKRVKGGLFPMDLSSYGRCRLWYLQCPISSVAPSQV
jgi:hypothetical protein